MNRRRRAVLAAGGAALTGAGLWAATGGLQGDDGFPVRVDRVAEGGGIDGPVRLPRPDAVTVVDLFATWCPSCPEQIDELRPVQEAYRGDDDVAVISVTNERFGEEFSPADLAEWWADHGGPWTLGHDPESAVMSAIRAPGLPFVAVVSPSGRVTWRRGGTGDTSSVERAVAAALER